MGQTAEDRVSLAPMRCALLGLCCLSTLVGCGGDVSLTLVSYPSDTADTDGPYRFEVIPTPNDPEEIAELTLEYSLSPSETASSLAFSPDDAGEQWVAQIPGGLAAGTAVSFRAKLVEASGDIVWEPLLEQEPLSFRILP